MQRFDRETSDSLYEEVVFGIEALDHPDCTIQLAGRFYEEVTDTLRAVAVLAILLDADLDDFRENLVLSARLREHYLARCHEAGYADFHAARGRADSFFDALAAGALDTARSIGALSPPDFREGDEYEDDFCYVKYLQETIAPRPDPDQADSLLARFEVALEGGDSARLAVCKSLRAKDQRAFDEAFDALLDERDAEVERDRLGAAEEDARAAAGTYLFIEGLALLLVARGVGLATRYDYRHCPAIARVPPPAWEA